MNFKNEVQLFCIILTFPSISITVKNIWGYIYVCFLSTKSAF